MRLWGKSVGENIVMFLNALTRLLNNSVSLKYLSQVLMLVRVVREAKIRREIKILKTLRGKQSIINL